MIIKYTFADGTVSEVEVDEATGEFITKYRQAEENLSRKERYHCFSIECCLYEGKELSTNENPKMILLRKFDNNRNSDLINAAMNSLSKTQRRRILLLTGGYSIREIARLEGVGTNSVAKSIWGARKIFRKFFPKRGVQNEG